jgi:hypothetical protein
VALWTTIWPMLITTGCLYTDSATTTLTITWRGYTRAEPLRLLSDFVVNIETRLWHHSQNKLYLGVT